MCIYKKKRKKKKDLYTKNVYIFIYIYTFPSPRDWVLQSFAKNHRFIDRHVDPPFKLKEIPEDQEEHSGPILKTLNVIMA